MLPKSQNIFRFQNSPGSNRISRPIIFTGSKIMTGSRLFTGSKILSYKYHKTLMWRVSFLLNMVLLNEFLKFLKYMTTKLTCHSMVQLFKGSLPQCLENCYLNKGIKLIAGPNIITNYSPWTTNLIPSVQYTKDCIIIFIFVILKRFFEMLTDMNKWLF